MRKLLPLALLLISIAVSAHAQQQVMCESINGVYRECRVGMTGKVRLVTELSQQMCYEGVTWGTRSEGIVWVERNCRGVFTVDAPGQKIVCESHKGTEQICPAELVNGISLLQQLSKADCVKGETWGFDVDRNIVWVDKGCRAEFILGSRTAPPQPKQLLDNPVVCESENNKKKVCEADTSGGVQLVRVLSESACAFGRDWGYDTKGIWVTRGCRAEFATKNRKTLVRSLKCESNDGARVSCAGETTYGVALVKLLSEAACVLDQSWGFDASGIWVDKGCRAQFALGGYRLPEGAVPANAARVTCESADRNRKVCPVGSLRGVGLIKQLSESDCVLNRTWGYDAEGIWVAGGCRAEFAVAR